MAEAETLYDIKMGGSRVMLRVRPPEGGKKASLTDIQKRLRELGVDYRHEVLFEIYRAASNQFEPLAKRELREYEVFVEVTPDGTEARLTVLPPDVGDDALTPAKVKEALERAKVTKGILYDEIRRVIAGKVENEPVVVARGQPVEHGTDGRIVFDEDEKEPEAPQVVEDNRADFREMNLVKNVQANEVIARLVLPTKGRDGFTVTGRELKATPGRPVKMRRGRNVGVSDDGTRFLAEKAGFVVVSNDRISVEDVLVLDNVNGASGNVRFTGVVRVNGQVEDGFTVEADKGIEVDGAVGKATLVSKGGIRLRGGAMGATMRCNGSVAARFFSECRVWAGEDVVVEEYILHSQVEAGGAIRVTKVPTGFINGGLVRAGTEVFAPNLGSEVGEDQTDVQVGVELDVRARADALELRMSRGRAQFDKLRRNLQVLQAQREQGAAWGEDTAESFAKMLAAARKTRGDLLDGVKTRLELRAAMTNDQREEPVVLIPNVVHPGARITMGRRRVTVKNALESCGLRVVDNELKLGDFGEVQRYIKAKRRLAKERPSP